MKIVIRLSLPPCMLVGLVLGVVALLVGAA
ncbi:MAG: hypothetical protein RL367_1638 [Pseudomonadota bacterium]